MTFKEKVEKTGKYFQLWKEKDSDDCTKILGDDKMCICTG